MANQNGEQGARMAMRWRSPFVLERLTLHSPYAPDECAMILNYHILRAGMMAGGSPPFTGSVGRGRFILPRKMRYIRYGFKPAASGRITSDGADGALVQLWLASAFVARIWLAPALAVTLAVTLAVALVWGGLIALIGAPAFIDPATPPAAIIILVAVSVMAVLMGALIPTALVAAAATSAARFAPDDRAYLITTIDHVLDAPLPDPQR